MLNGCGAISERIWAAITASRNGGTGIGASTSEIEMAAVTAVATIDATRVRREGRRGHIPLFDASAQAGEGHLMGQPFA